MGKNEDKICDDCAQFSKPTWLTDRELGICLEGMFGDGEPSDKNDSACEFFEQRRSEE